MKFYLLFLATLSPFLAFSQWQEVHSGGSLNLVDGCFISDSVGFVISANGVILKSIDQGTTWNEQAALPGIFTSICKAGPDTLYAGGNCIYRSSDRGISWHLVTSLSDTVTELGFFGSKTGFSIVPNVTHCVWAGTDYYVDSYYIAKSTDFGATWQQELGIGERTNRIQFINDSVAYFNGGAYIGYPHCFDGWYDVSKRTTNRGVAWSVASQPPPGRTFYSFYDASAGYFIRPGLYWLPDDKFKIWKTADGGSTFIQSYTEILDPTVKQCLFINEFDGYLLGNSSIYVTGSNGLCWNQDYSTNGSLSKLFYNPSHYLFGIGSNGLILKKHIVEHTSPDTVYRVKTGASVISFGLVPVNTSEVKQLSVTNTGNVPVTLTLASSDPFRISLDGSSFGNSVSVPCIPFDETTVYIQFTPTGTDSYFDTIFISADSLETIRIPVSGYGFSGLSGNITHDTLICTDTLSVIGNVTINKGARLTICPGTYIRFMENYRIQVEGVLDARGDSLQNIRFGVPAANSKWNGIIVDNQDYMEQTLLSWCILPERCDNASILITNGNVLMDHCSVSNLSGKGIRVSGPHSRLILENSNIHHTSANAVEFSGCDSSAITDCILDNNARAIVSSTIAGAEIRGNQIYNNTSGAIQGGGKMRISQNKIFSNQEGIRFSGSSVWIDHNEIHHHYAQGIACDSADSCKIIGNKIFNNYNCGIQFSGAYILIENNEIYNNTARGIFGETGGKGCYIIQNLVFNNQTLAWAGRGAGIYLTPGSQSKTTAYLVGNTICNNWDFSHISELAVDGKPSYDLDIQVINNVFYNAGSEYGMVAWWNVTSTILFNCINQLPLNGSSNINADAEFVHPTTGIGVLTSIGAYNWELKSTSPCINTGDTIQTPFQLPYDFNGNPRVCGNRIDMGAFEYQGPFSIQDIDPVIDVRVYPNPSKGIVHVFVDSPSRVEISLYDISGRKLLQHSFTRTTTITLSPVIQGLLFYELRNHRGLIATGKIVKE